MGIVKNIVLIFGFLFVIGLFSGDSNTEDNLLTGQATSQEVNNAPVYANVSFDKLSSFFWIDSGKTDLQKENIIEENEDMRITGKGIVDNVDKTVFGDYVVELMDPTNEFNPLFVRLYFRESEKDKLSALSQYSGLNFDCRIRGTSLGSLVLEDCIVK